MGLISHNAAITPAEVEHGHRITYSLDTLERDAVAGGLRVVHRSGIFFKALANFQWDQVIPAGIVDEAYLDGCYRLGQRYPALFSSIFLVCERGARTLNLAPPGPEAWSRKRLLRHPLHRHLREREALRQRPVPLQDRGETTTESVGPARRGHKRRAGAARGRVTERGGRGGAKVVGVEAGSH